MAAAPDRPSTTSFSARWSDVLEAARAAEIDEEHALVLVEELAVRAEEREGAARPGLLRRLLRAGRR